MKKWGLLFLSLFSVSVLAQDYSASAHWESRQIGLNHSHQGVCRAMLQGAAPILNAIQARNKRFRCGSGYGSGLTFESLQLGPDATGATVPGEWIHVQIQTSIDSNYCYYTSQAVDEVMFNIAARKVSSQVMCNGGGQGFLYLDFEALVPEYN